MLPKRKSRDTTLLIRIWLLYQNHQDLIVGGNLRADVFLYKDIGFRSTDQLMTIKYSEKIIVLVNLKHLFGNNNLKKSDTCLKEIPDFTKTDKRITLLQFFYEKGKLIHILHQNSG